MLAWIAPGVYALVFSNQTIEVAIKPRYEGVWGLKDYRQTDW